MVRVTGLEPAHREIPDPKSGASANFATPAKVCIFNFNYIQDDFIDYILSLVRLPISPHPRVPYYYSI